MTVVSYARVPRGRVIHITPGGVGIDKAGRYVTEQRISFCGKPVRGVWRTSLTRPDGSRIFWPFALCPKCERKVAEGKEAT